MGSWGGAGRWSRGRRGKESENGGGEREKAEKGITSGERTTGDTRTAHTLNLALSHTHKSLMGFKNIMASHISKAERAHREGGGGGGRGLGETERERERNREQEKRDKGGMNTPPLPSL
jgi:hypothetical protein